MSLLVVALLTVLLPALTAPAVQARSSTSVSVTRTVSRSVTLTGDQVLVRGRVTPAPTGAPVRLQRYVGGRWRTLLLTRVAADDTYRFTISARTAGSWRHRVTSAADAGRRAAASGTFPLTVLPCATRSAPDRGTAAWFTRPGRPGVNPIAVQLSRLFCSAARGSTIDISMYFIRAAGRQSDVDPLLQSLRRIAKYRAVKVRVMLEGKLYGRGQSLHPSLARLRTFARVLLCHQGCKNERPERPGQGIMHHKFVTISDMAWRRGVDPAVVVSSANWSQSQLKQFWQNAVLFHNDATMFRQFHIQFEQMVACAAPRGCSSWAGRLAALSLDPAAYGLTLINGLWRDSAPVERMAAAHTGRGAFFSPWLKRDPIAAGLRRYRCTPEHGTVLVDHMFITAGRSGIIDALVDLKAQGCRVEIILRHLSDGPLLDGVRRVREAKLSLSCVPLVHGKAIMIDAVRRSDGRPDKALWVGSQSLGANALRNNDETLLRMSTAEASGAPRTGNALLFARFVDDWTVMKKRARPCG